jgi:hypothetical protein
MRLRAEAAGKSVQGSRERVQTIRAGRVPAQLAVTTRLLSGSLTGCSGHGTSRYFAAAPAQSGLLSKPKKKASLNSPPIGGVC